MNRIVTILIVLCGLSLVSGQSPTRCHVCQQPISGSFYWVNSPARAERVPVCQACAKRDTLCFTCGLPVVEGYQKLRDGRLLCETDAAQAVFSREAMTGIFAEARRDLQRMFHDTGRLPDSNVTPGLVDGTKLLQLQRSGGSIGEPSHTLGMTHSRKTATGQMEHQIYLLEGLGPARLAAIAAHEWTHAWLFENVPVTRKLKPDAVEGFCELVAYRLMQLRNQPLEQKAILANRYTGGQIALLAEIQSETQFLRVVDWMKSGQETVFDQDNTQRMLARNLRPAFQSIWRPSVVTPVPEYLSLKGIGGTAKRRFALINNRTFEANESATIRVGSRAVVVRCLEIRDRSVRLQIEGEPSPVELQMANQCGAQVGTQPVPGMNSRLPGDLQPLAPMTRATNSTRTRTSLVMPPT